MIYIGIDPGQAGGIALIDDIEDYITITPMPATPQDILDWMRESLDEDVRPIARIEKVHAMPGNGVSSMFKFGMGYGGLIMMLTALKICFEEVTPQAWQKELGITPRKKKEPPRVWKNRLKEKAQQLFPQLPNITLSVADALLIAEYCRRVSK